MSLHGRLTIISLSFPQLVIVTVLLRKVSVCEDIPLTAILCVVVSSNQIKKGVLLF